MFSKYITAIEGLSAGAEAALCSWTRDATGTIRSERPRERATRGSRFSKSQRDRDLPRGERLLRRERLLGGRNPLLDGLELGQGLARVGASLLSVLFQAFEDESVQIIGDLGVQLREGLGHLTLVLHAHRKRRVPFEGDPSRHHFIKDDPQRVEVRSAIDVLPLHLLGRHVFRASRSSRPRP
ncbi:MAG: hypothetical protein MZV63_13550 [Marinilabiliales bacterium]|nr:hypothetical protein [Marinilabiliales bacterium]